MRRLIFAVLLGFAIGTLPVSAADNAPKTPAAGKTIDPAKGRFHQVHTKKLKLACDACHAADNKDVLFLRKDEALAGGMPQVDRQLCASCHTAPNKPAWYGAAVR